MAIACQHIIAEVFKKNDVAEGVSCLIMAIRKLGN